MNSTTTVRLYDGTVPFLSISYSGKETLFLVSGRRRNFEVSPALMAGTSLRIKVRENKKGFEFGLITAEAENLKDYKAVVPECSTEE